MKKKELLKRIKALEAIVKPIEDLQKASEKAKELEAKIDLSKGPYSPEVIKYDLRPVSDDVANAFLDRFKVEEKKEVIKVPNNLLGFKFRVSGNIDYEITKIEDDRCYISWEGNINATDYEYSNVVSLIQSGKWAEVVEEKQYTPKIGDVVYACNDNISEQCIIGKIKDITSPIGGIHYGIGGNWYSKIEPITDENIIKLFN